MLTDFGSTRLNAGRNRALGADPVLSVIPHFGLFNASALRQCAITNGSVNVLSSMIIGRDMRQMFHHYGIPPSSTALESIAAHNLPQLSPEFYALVQGQGNQLEKGKWVNLATSVPAYPF